MNSNKADEKLGSNLPDKILRNNFGGKMQFQPC